MILLKTWRSNSWAVVLVAVMGCGPAKQAAPEPQPAASDQVPPSTPAPAPAPPPAATSAVQAADPYHPAPHDTVDAVVYDGWKQYFLQCSRCHGEDANGSSFGPSLLVALKPDGSVPTQDEFVNVLIHGRRDKGMPSAATMGLDQSFLPGLYQYLKGRSDGVLRAGRPARRSG
jgi:mono/diheme cytochrome c family protein